MIYKHNIILRQKAKQNFDTKIRVNNLIARNDAVLERENIANELEKIIIQKTKELCEKEDNN